MKAIFLKVYHARLVARFFWTLPYTRPNRTNRTDGGRVIEHPWVVVASHLMEFAQSKGQYKYVIVFQDLFTLWIELRPLRAATGKNVAKAFEELVLFRWGISDYLLADSGKEFDNKDVGRILEVYGVTKVTTPPYHHQANPVERSNRTITTMIKRFVKLTTKTGTSTFTNCDT